MSIFEQNASQFAAPTPPRTWRRWWLAVPGWLRIAVWAGVISIIVHVVCVIAIWIRIQYGLIEPQELAELRKRDAYVIFASDRQGEPFRGFNRLMDGWRGRSCNDVIGVRFNSPATDNDLKLVAKHFKNLTSLHIENSDVSSEGLRVLSACSKLQDLDLSNSDFRNDQISCLNSLSNLGALDLQGTLVDDDAIENFKQMSALKSINLAHTNVTFDAIKAWRLRAFGLRILTDKDYNKNVVLGTIVWSDGRRGRRFPGHFRIYTVRPNGGRYGVMSSNLTPMQPGIRWDSESFRDGDGKYTLTCELGPYVSDPVLVEVVSGEFSTQPIEFRMSVTMEEALKADRESKPTW